MCSGLLVQTQGQFFSSHSQRGQKPSVRLTETASWAQLSLAHADPDPLWASTSPRVTRTEPTSPRSATAAQDSAGASTATDRRSPGLAPGLEANQSVGGSHVYENKPTARLCVNRKNNLEMCLSTQDLPQYSFYLYLGDHGGMPPPVRPTPRPDVHPLQPGTHLLFAQSGRIEHVPMDGQDMKKTDARALLHLPVSPCRKRWKFRRRAVCVCVSNLFCGTSVSPEMCQAQHPEILRICLMWPSECEPSRKV